MYRLSAHILLTKPAVRCFLLAAVFLFSASLQCVAQLAVAPHYKPAGEIVVISESSDTLAFPFAGGMNSCQFSNIDINLDGVQDLLVFDRHGNRLLPFIAGQNQQAQFIFSPEYAKLFPAIEQWVQCADYNGDGKKDLFTYTSGGIRVYRNDADAGLRFTQVTFPFLLSQQGNTLTNILVTNADYPAIADVDNDGDLDILTFWGLGSFVEWHRNTSRERFGNSDSLTFMKSSSCWGHFAEGAESNLIKLDTCAGGYKSMAAEPKDNDPKHTGSTLLLHDLDGDGLPDLTIGDVDFSTLVHLRNSGSGLDARMTSQTTDFPGGTRPLLLNSFPVAMLADANNDGVRDLLVSPFEPSLTKSAGLQSAFLYLNRGSDVSPRYVFSTDSFLQDEMLDFGSGAYPVFFDYNADGLTDLLVGNYGNKDTCIYSALGGLMCSYISTVALLLNEGSAGKPKFRLADRNIAHLDTLELQSLIPALADMDGDGDMDMVCGNSKGKFVYCENKGLAGQQANFTFADPAWQGLDAGDFSSPQLIDIDRDGLTDLVTGKRNGKLSYYRNTGTAGHAAFTLVSDKLGGVSVTDTSLSNFGYATPCFYKNNMNKLVLMAGSEFGDIFRYDGIEENIAGDFVNRGRLSEVREGWRTGIALGDLNGDSLADLAVGNYAGGLNIYFGSTEQPSGTGEIKAERLHLNIFPNPATDRIRVEIAGLNITEIQQVAVRELSGKVLLQQSGISSGPFLDISSLRNGMYIVEARSGKGICAGKLAVSR